MDNKTIRLLEGHLSEGNVDIINKALEDAKQEGIKEGVHAITQSILQDTLYKSEEIKAYLEGLKQDGRKEVIEWITENSYGFDKGDGVMIRKMVDDDWKAKLKEWNIT